MVDILTAFSRDGGTGRRTGFKIPRWQQRASSILAPGTNKLFINGAIIYMIEHKVINEELHQITIRPNPSMPWPQLKKIYTIFACFILIIAIILSSINLYLAIPFYGVEVIFLGYALYISSLRSTYYEEVKISQFDINVSFIERKKKLEFKYVRQWTSFQYEAGTITQPLKIFIGSGKKKIYIGQKVNEDDRKKLAKIFKTIS